MSKALCFLQITAELQDYPFFTVFLIIETPSQNISITLFKILLKSYDIEAAIGGKSSLELFWKTVPSAEKYCCT